MSLLEQAKLVRKVQSRTKITEEELELAIAFLKKEVSAKQIADTIGIGNSNVYAWAMYRLREAYRRGLMDSLRSL